MGFDNIFRNRLMQPTARPMLTTGGVPTEKAIVWSADASGLLARIRALEAKVEQLSSAPAVREVRVSSDLDPDPDVSATTGYEYASDGTLRAYVEVTVNDRRVYEVALLGLPTIVYATKDATVDEAFPDSSFGEDSLIEASVGDASKRAWLQFDWGNYPDGLWAAKPILAVLRLAKSQPSSGEITLCLGYEDLSGADWDESTITWNNQPNIGGIISQIPDNAESDYTFIDLTSLFYAFWGVRQGNQDFVPYGLVVLAQGNGGVQWESLEGATNDVEKPQIWYWEKVEKSQLIGGSVRAAKIYGTPGSTYYLVHRRLDENNNPGRWSDPIEISFPSVGAIPPAPADPPLVWDTNISNLKEIILSCPVPPDFSVYEVEISYTDWYTGGTGIIPIITRSDRFSHNFFAGATGRDYRLRYRLITRSGVCSDWSPYTDVIPIPTSIRLARPVGNMSGGIYVDEDENIYLVRSTTAGRTYDIVNGNILSLLHDADKEVKYNNIQSCSDEVHYYGPQTTTSTDWVTLTNASRTLTPPGISGEAYMLLMAWVSVWSGNADYVQFTFKVDGEVSSNEEGRAVNTVAETVTFFHRARVTAGQPHTFELCWKSGNGGEAYVYRYKFIITHIGNV